jgi:diphthine methyl ester synthase
MTESNFEEICLGCEKEDVSFLVVGDPFGQDPARILLSWEVLTLKFLRSATTHSTILLHLHKNELPYRIIHNASILNSVAVCGLPLYDFGQTISIPFFTDSWRPSSWFEKITVNLKGNMHTLCLLDIKVKEISEANLARGRKVYEKPRYMSPQVALEQLVEVLAEDRDEDGLISMTTPIISISRVGSSTQSIRCSTIEEMKGWNADVFGNPLHSLVIVSERRIGEVEKEWLRIWGWKG